MCTEVVAKRSGERNKNPESKDYGVFTESAAPDAAIAIRQVSGAMRRG
jgi:hypothetical protein